MAARPGISVLIPTYNRSAVLRETLRAWLNVDREGLECEIVVIANNCSDDTAEVVKQFENLLPIRLVVEPRPGKNCALNRAVRVCSLREIVAFTDDDTSPAEDWLRQIVETSSRWPEISVFGGAVDVLWPSGSQPTWAEPLWIRAFGYSFHRYAEKEQFYTPPDCPFGPNFWIRRSVLNAVPLFDETIGPRPKERKMGSETSFLLELHRAGFKILFCPLVAVLHRVLDAECRIPALRRRGYTFGRGQVRLFQWHRANLYRRSRIAWAIVCAADYVYTAFQFIIGVLHIDPNRNCELTVRSMIRFGQLRETRLLAWEHFRGKLNSHRPDQNDLIGESILSRLDKSDAHDLPSKTQEIAPFPQTTKDPSQNVARN